MLFLSRNINIEEVFMYIKKLDKLKIIKWYIRNYINVSPDINIDDISNLKELEKIVRTSKNIHNEIYGCQGCHYEGRSYCKQCSNCKEWHWDKNIIEETDNYTFRYGYYSNFYQ